MAKVTVDSLRIPITILGEAITQTPEYKTFLVNIEKLGRHNMAGTAQGVQTQDVIKISATSGLTPAPQARDHKVEVTKIN